jgi:hypothetical protein
MSSKLADLTRAAAMQPDDMSELDKRSKVAPRRITRVIEALSL